MQFYISFSANGLLEHFTLQDNTPLFNHGYFHLQNKQFTSVLAFEDGQFYLKSQVTGYKITDCGGDIFTDTPLYDGMSIDAIAQEEGKSYSLVVQKLDLLQVKHQYFYSEEEILIGSGTHCHIQPKNTNSLAPEHVTITKQGGCMVATAEGRNQLYVNSKLAERKRLETGDVLWCQGLSVVYMGEFIAVSCQGFTCNLDEFHPKVAQFPPLEQFPTQLERPPRVSVPLETATIEIAPPPKKPTEALPVSVTTVPSFFLGVLSLISFALAGVNLATGGSFEMLLITGLSGFIALVSAMLLPGIVKSNHKKLQNKQEDRRMEKYLHYINEKNRELESKYNRNRKVWNDVLSPAPEKLVKMLDKYQAENCLWERTPRDEDFLALRLGQGNHDFEVQVKLPQESFDLDEDPLYLQPKSIASKYKVLKDVPEVISLVEHGQVGVFGQKEKVYELLHALMMEVMSLHSPDIVKIACFFSPEDKEHFLWAKDLPAVWSNDQSIRFMASKPEEAHAVLRHIEHRCAHKPQRETYVFFVSNPALLQEKFLTKHFAQEDTQTKIKDMYSIFFAEQFSSLPNHCKAVVRCNLNYSGVYRKKDQQNWFLKFYQDDAGDHILQSFKQAMLSVPFPLHNDQEELVDKVGFLDMFHCACVEDLQIAKRWLNHRSYKTLSAPLGLTAGEALFSLDIHEEYHGCHGLVVGEVELDKTTLLQSLVLSMMVCHSPLDFSVLLMEFTGTHFVTPFQKAPHVLGTVNSIAQCRGIMIPLRMEIQRRKRLFRNIAKEFQLDSLDINGYQKYFLQGKVTEVMTRIAVVVDEFLPLLQEAPKLLEELLHLVKVGQRLGIHLILGTATPSVVKDAHFASQFRVCLNLSHTGDFQELMGVTPSTTLRHAGRCIVQVGQNEVFAEVQTGNCNQSYVKQEHFLPPHAQTVDVINYAGERIRRCPIKNRQEITGKTQLEAVLELLDSVSDKNNCRVEPFLFHEIHYAREEGQSNPDYVPVDEQGNPLPVPPPVPDQNTSNFAYLTQGKELQQTVPQEEPVSQKEPAYVAPPQEESAQQEPYEEETSYEEPYEEETSVEEPYEEETSYEEPYEDETSYEEPYEDETSVEEPNEETSYDEPYEEETSVEEPYEETSYEEPYEEETSYEEPYEEDNSYEEPYEEETSYEEPYEEETSYEEPYEKETSYEEPNEETSYEEPYEEETSYEEPNEEASYDEPYEEETSYEEPYEKETSYEEPYEDETSYDEPYEEVPPTPETVQPAASSVYEEKTDYVPYPKPQIPEASAPTASLNVKPFPATKDAKSSTLGLNAAREAFIQHAGKTATLPRADFSTIRFQEGLFIGGSQEQVVENLLLTFAKFTKIDYVFSSNSHGKCSKLCDRLIWGEDDIDRAIEEIRIHLWGSPEESCVLLIPSYHQFCQVVSQRSIDRLNRILKKDNHKLIIMTGDTPEHLAPYKDTDFSRYTLKQKQGIVTNPQVLEELLPFMLSQLDKPTVEVNPDDFLYFYENQWHILYM